MKKSLKLLLMILPGLVYICEAMILGFAAYRLSFPLCPCENTPGAAKTSAYYAVAPFAGGRLFYFSVLF